MSPAPAGGRGRPVERFRATSGRLVGCLSLAAIAGLLVYLAVGVHTLTGARIAAALVLAAVVIWVTQLRPRAAVFPDELHLQNSLRDATVPLAAVEEVSVRRVLAVWAAGERYVCIGIGRPLRTMVRAKSRGPSSLLGWDRLESYTEESTPLRPDQTAMSYPDFVETRISGLVEDAKRRSGGEVTAPHRTWAWPEVAALAVSAVVLAVTLLL